MRGLSEIEALQRAWSRNGERLAWVCEFLHEGRVPTSSPDRPRESSRSNDAAPESSDLAIASGHRDDADEGGVTIYEASCDSIAAWPAQQGDRDLVVTSSSGEARPGLSLLGKLWGVVLRLLIPACAIGTRVFGG